MRTICKQNEILNQPLTSCKKISTIDLIVELSEINDFLNRENSLLRKMTFAQSDWKFREFVKKRRTEIMYELNHRS
jgi:hypothetical protein